MSRLLRWWWVSGLAVVAAAAVIAGRLALRPPPFGADAIGPPLDAPELVLQTGHSLKLPVQALAFSPDGRRLASAGSNSPIKIWDVGTGRELRSLAGHTSDVLTLAFSPDGTELASGTEVGTELKVWEVGTGRTVFANPRIGSLPGIPSVSFAPKGRALFFGGAVSGVLDFATGEVQELLADRAPLAAVVVSPDWRYLAAARLSPQGGSLDIVDRSSLQATFAGRTDQLRLLAFSADSRLLASSGIEPSVTVREVPTGREKLTVQVQRLVRAIAISPRGRWLAVGTDIGQRADGDDIGVRLWDLASGAEVRPFPGLSALDRAVLGGVHSLAFSPDEARIAMGRSGGVILIFDLDGRRSPRRLDSRAEPVDEVAPSTDGRWLATAGSSHIDLWSLDAGTPPRPIGVPPGGTLAAIAVSGDGAWLAAGMSDGSTWLAEPRAGTRWTGLGRHAAGVTRAVFSHDGARLASAGADGQVRVWSVPQRRQLCVLEGLTGEPLQLGFSPDDRLLMGLTWADLAAWDVLTGIRRPVARQYADAVTAAFSADWRRMAWVTLVAAGPKARLNLADFGTGRVATVEFSGDLPDRLAFSGDGGLLAGFLPFQRRLAVWDASTGFELKSFDTRDFDAQGSVIRDLAFTADGFHLVTAGWDGTVRIWQALGGRLLASLVSMERYEPVPGSTQIARSTAWAVVTPGGYFDGSPDAWRQMQWRFRADLVSMAPVEAFFNEFYAPGLLADVIRGVTRPPRRELAKIDRRQPRLDLAPKDPAVAASGRAAARTLEIRIDVTAAPPDDGHPQAGGARDLRVFRNGSLVHATRGELLTEGQTRATIVAPVPVVAGDNYIVAYAFNRDNVKSADATLTLAGDETLRRPGTTRVLAIGVDEYANAAYNLRYAVADATAVAAAVAAARRELEPAARVEVTTLTNREATRANILGALRRLAGAEAEDSVIIYFAGHGTAAGSRFYLIPHDLGYLGSRDRLDRDGLATIRSHSVSDEELEAAVEPIVAERLVLIIDACNSGQALDAEEKRRGPMNSRGLAQLAYEKGMHILTAAQSYQAALEAARLGHGYLTYALIGEGLGAAADREPANGLITVREWFEFAVERVPAMQRARLLRSRLLQHDVAFVEGDEREEDVAKRRLQEPRAFYRREGEGKPYVIARSKAG